MIMLAEITNWPDAVLGSVTIISIASAFFIGSWPWQGIIHRTYTCKCKSKNCPCKNTDEDED